MASAYGDQLKNKYDRLCAEYKKLRNSYKNFKEAAAAELKETKDKYEQLFTVTQQKFDSLEWKESENSSDSEETVCPKCHSAKIRSKCYPSKEEKSFHSPTPDVELHGDPGSTLPRFTEALVEWSKAVNLGHRRELSYSATQNALESRVAELESQLCDMSVQYQMARKRHLMASEASNASINSEIGKEFDGQHVNSNTGDDVQGKYEAEKQLLLELMQQRIKSANNRADCAVARATFLEEELKSLLPHLVHIANELIETRERCTHQANMYAAHQREMLNRNHGMAEQMANLTDELQQLRSGCT